MLSTFACAPGRRRSRRASRSEFRIQAQPPHRPPQPVRLTLRSARFRTNVCFGRPKQSLSRARWSAPISLQTHPTLRRSCQFDLSSMQTNRLHHRGDEGLSVDISAGVLGRCGPGQNGQPVSWSASCSALISQLTREPRVVAASPRPAAITMPLLSSRCHRVALRSRMNQRSRVEKGSPMFQRILRSTAAKSHCGCDPRLQRTDTVPPRSTPRPTVT